MQAINLRGHRRFSHAQLNRRGNLHRLRRINPGRLVGSLKLATTNDSNATQYECCEDQCSVDDSLHGYAAKSLMLVRT